MSKFVYNFVVIDEMPTNLQSTTELSVAMSNKYGSDGWELVSVTPISSTNPPGMLISFQKEDMPN